MMKPVLMDTTEDRAEADADERVEHYEFALNALRAADVTTLGDSSAFHLEAERTVATRYWDADPNYEGWNGEREATGHWVNDEAQAIVLIAGACNEYDALALMPDVAIGDRDFGRLALEPGSPLMALSHEPSETYIATFSVHDLRNGLTLEDLTMEYRRYAEAFVAAECYDTREWRAAYESGLPVEVAVAPFLDEMYERWHAEDLADGVPMEDILAYQIEQAAGFGVMYIDGEWHV